MPHCKVCSSDDVYWREKEAIDRVTGKSKYIWALFQNPRGQERISDTSEHVCKWKHVKHIQYDKRPWAWRQLAK